MISICIPVFNYNVRDLLTELERQIQSAGIPIEIILIDDASDAEFRDLNKESCLKHRYIELNENVGRASIRNLFLQYAGFNYLLFLDCDSRVGHDDFLKKYLQLLPDCPDVVCGGRIYQAEKPGFDFRLRWNYGRLKESRPAERRNVFPFRSFMTNNFMIKKELMSKIRFDERLSTYGHEDTLFGYALKKHGAEIVHINNPVINGDHETNKEFLLKTKAGIQNLVRICNFTKNDPELLEDIALLRFHKKISRLDWLMLPIFKIFEPGIRFIICKLTPNLMLFNIFKLGWLIRFSKTGRDL